MCVYSQDFTSVSDGVFDGCDEVIHKIKEL